MSIIYYDYQEINSILMNAQTDIQGILDNVHEIQRQVNTFPWKDEISAVHFKNSVSTAMLSAKHIVDDFNALRETALKVNANMQEFNASIARQWL